jgi:uncharacterized protein YggE
MGKPDSITVVATHREEVRARHADIALSVMATSLYTGEAAFKKAKELAHVVGLLSAAGLPDGNITLLGIHAGRSSPIIGRSNTATYLLRVHCPDLDILPEILGVLTAQRTVAMDELVWRYADDKAIRAKWLDGCLADARERAKRIAAGLGVKALGVHSYMEKWIEPPDEQRRVSFAPVRVATAGKAAPDERRSDFPFPLVTTMQLELSVEVEFRVSPLGGTV